HPPPSRARICATRVAFLCAFPNPVKPRRQARVSLEIVTSLSQALRTFELPCHEATSFHQDVCPWRFGADFGCLFCRQASLVSRLDFDAAAGCGSASLTDGRCEALQGLARPTFRPRVKRRRSI
ncbi:unnamed protein product, partial [Effrenium voratum]